MFLPAHSPMKGVLCCNKRELTIVIQKPDLWNFVGVYFFSEVDLDIK